MPDRIAEAAPILVAALRDNLGTPGIVYAPAAGGSYTIIGIIADPDPAEASYPGSTTTAKIVKSDLGVTPTQGDTITAGTTQYTVVDVKERKIGLWSLALRKKP